MDDREERTELAASLYAQLEATEELPIDHRANRWLGEAQAVTAGIVEADAETRRKGAEQVVKLLESVDETGHEEADRRVERALSLAERLARG